MLRGVEPGGSALASARPIGHRTRAASSRSMVSIVEESTGSSSSTASRLRSRPRASGAASPARSTTMPTCVRRSNGTRTRWPGRARSSRLAGTA